MTGKNSKKIIQQLLLMIYSKKEKYIMPTFQNTTQKCEKQIILFMISKKEGCLKVK